MSRIVLFHTLDPRGRKVGGIETHVRLILGRHPPETRVLLVGLDEVGDLLLGSPLPLCFEERSIDFLPVARIEPESVNRAAKTLRASVTLRFALGALRYLPAIRAAADRHAVSCEIERFEFALLPKLLGLPFVLMVHNEGTKADKMDSLIKHYWWLHLANERVAVRLANHVFAVNPSIAARVAGMSPRAAEKTEILSVSVDTQRFRPTPFPDDDEFRVCFAGRLDAFKDPPLMLECLRLLSKRLHTAAIGRFARLSFHYVGATDPTCFAEFQAVSELTVRHGSCAPAEVAMLMARSHVGLITSFFEGLPCYLLEMLASGRPVAAIDLPQFAGLIVPGLSGKLVSRRSEARDTAAAMADALEALARAIAEHKLDPHTIASRVEPYSVDMQMGRLFARHALIAIDA